MADNADQLLVKKAQKGESRAFDLLVLKYQHRLASLVSRYLNDSHAIPDVVQEAFIKAYQALPSFRGDSAFYTWLYRIAINCAYNYLDAKGRRPNATSADWEALSQSQALPASLTDMASPEQLLACNQLEQSLQQALNALPEDLRSAITLREYEGLSYESIAHIINTPIGTVRSRIFRARDRLEKTLRQQSNEGEKSSQHPMERSL